MALEEPLLPAAPRQSKGRSSKTQTKRFVADFTEAAPALSTDLKLSDLILALNCDLGFEAFFKNLVLILNTHFGAQRVSLELPRDPSDIANIPWGLRALWNKNNKIPDSPILSQGKAKADSPGRHKAPPQNQSPNLSASEVSSSCLSQDANSVPSTPPTPEVVVSRPYFSRHSSFKERLAKLSISRKGKSVPSPLIIDSSNAVGRLHPNLSDTTLNSLSVNDHQCSDQSSPPPVPPKPRGKSSFLLFGNLRALDWEADPLVDAEGILNVLNYEQIVLLQREYINTNGGQPKFVDTEQSSFPTWNYDYDCDSSFSEFPSQSSGTSELEGAFRDDSDGTERHINDDPPKAHTPYKSNDSTYSLLHLLLVPPGMPDLNANDSPLKTAIDPPNPQKRAPVAIVSILSSYFPFPNELRDALMALAPHIAAAFVQARAYSSLNRQLADFTKAKGYNRWSLNGNTNQDIDSLGHTDTYNASNAAPDALDAIDGNDATEASSIAPSRNNGNLAAYRGRPTSSPYHSRFSHSPRHRHFRHTRRNVQRPRSRPLSRVPVNNKLDFREISLGNKPYYSSLREDKISRHSLSSRSIRSFSGDFTGSSTDLISPHLQLHWFDDGPATALDIGQPYISQDTPLPISHTPESAAESSSSKSKISLGKRRIASKNLKKLLHSYATPSVAEPVTNSRSSSSTFPEEKVEPDRLSQIHQPNVHGQLISIDDGDRDFKMATPSNKLLRTIIDAIPVHVFTAEPVNGDITWVSNRTLAFRGITAREFCDNPLDSVHEEDRAGYSDSWEISLRKGVPLSAMVRVCRFDGRYRAFFVRAVPLRDEKSTVAHWFFTMMDIHNQHQSEIAAIQTAHETAWEHKYKILAESSPTANFMIHPAKGLVYANQKWLDYSGRTVEESLGLQYLSCVHPEDRDKAMIPLTESGNVDKTKTTFDGKKYRDGTYSVELRLKNRDDEYRWNLVLFSCSEENSTKDALWFATSTDIQDQKMTQEKLEEAKDAAQRMVESKTRFLSNMSHEIRTPLIGISGMVNFLLETSLTEEQLDYCHTISSSADALLMVINDILDLSKVESGKMTLEYTWFLGRQLIEEVSELLTPMAIAKNLELNCVVDKSVPEWIKGDRIRLRQVLLNLIGNAIKFTDIGEIFTICSANIIDAETLMLKIEVHDTGRGFTPEDAAKRMFKPYSQIAQINNSESSSNYVETTGSPTGTGLGLVISRQLIELHGGRLTCVGEKGIGSVFRFNCRAKLPTAQDHPSEYQVAKHQHLSSVDGRHHPNVVSTELGELDQSSHLLNILVVCPWKFTCMSIEHHIRATLSNPDVCKIQCVQGIEQIMALESDMSNWTHVVINLTEVEVTVDVLRLLFNGNISQTCQLIVLSSPYMRTSVVELLEENSFDASKLTFLSKPLKPSRYSVVFDPARKTHASHDIKMMDAKRVSSSIKKVSDGLRDFAHRKPYKILLAEDNLVNQKVIVKFLTRAGIKCDVASDGEICVETFYRSVNSSMKDTSPFDLILCDLDMPRKDGFETCREIRGWEDENKVTKRIPIVALSAYVMSDVASNCNKAGFDKYLSKPVDFGILKDVLIELLQPEEVPDALDGI